MRKRILFVNSDFSELQAMGFSCDPSHDWDFLFQDSASKALQQLATAPADAVVTDQYLSDMSGMELLDRVLQRQPNTKTLLIADLEQKNADLNYVGTTHQILAKPCDRKQLTISLNRAFDQEAWVPSKATSKLTSQMSRLPSLPYLYFRVVRELRAPEPSLVEIGNLVARDPSMSAKLLQLVNSASLGLASQVVNPCDAVMHLGFKKTQSLLLLAHTCSFFEDIQDSHFSVEKLWQHSLRTGTCAQLIAEEEKAPASVIEEAFTAGLLHDIGKLALAANYPVLFTEALHLATSFKSELEAERKVFETTHAEVGACLLSKWGLPWPLILAVAFHHAPIQIAQNRFCPLTAVHVANAIDQALASENKLFNVNRDYLAAIGLSDRLDGWQKTCRSAGRGV